MITEILMAAAATAQLSIPTERLVEQYPSWAIIEGKQTGAIVSFWMDPKGRTYDCVLLGQIGDEELAEEVCSVLRSTRMEPAMDVDGKPIAAHFVTMIKMVLPGTDQASEILGKEMRPDAEFDLNKLPEGITGPYTSKVAVKVNASGQIIDCNSIDDGHQGLDRLACDQFLGTKLAEGKNKDGSPIPYVRSFKVKFSAESTE